MKRYVEWDGGWHFVYLMNDDEISNKLNRFDHEIEHLLGGQKYIKKNWSTK